jgi:hypothetical protein
MPSTILSDNGVTSGSAGLKTTAASDGALALQTTTAGGTATTALTIDTSQNVGIGTTSIAANTRLLVSGGRTNLIANSDAFALGVGYASAGAYYLGANSANDSLLFSNSGGSERMRIDSSGNVGIGTTSPNKISGTTLLSVNTATATNYAGLDISTADAVRTALYANNSASYLETRTSTPLVFGTNTTERMRINAGAPILCLAGGSTSATGTGIAFPATQSASSDANTLDDYEEGTFTPVFAFTTPGTSSFTYTTRLGTYTKIGNVVYLYILLIVSTFSKGTASGNFEITNLPFQSINVANANDQGLNWGAYNTPLPTTAGVTPNASVLGATTRLSLQLASNGSTANSPWPDPTAGAQYKFNGFYMVN